MFRLRLIICFALLSISTTLCGQIASVDSGSSGAAISVWDVALLKEWGASQPWLRIRARPDPGKSENRETVAREIAGLSQLRDLGFKPIPFYRWSPQSWITGVRVGGGQRVPLDLREAYQRGFNYGAAYGAVVVGFEIENEPDIAFMRDNAETYMAFQKAVYLGLKKGAISGKLKAESAVARSEERGAGSTEQALGDKLKTESSEARSGEQGAGSFEHQSPRPWMMLGRPATRKAATVLAKRATVRPDRDIPPDGPIIAMAPLALPPGPYLEQLTSNGLFSYTDAFNYHYYGYAEDFSGVYEQFRSAVAELSDKHKALSGKLRATDGRPSASREATQGKTEDGSWWTRLRQALAWQAVGGGNESEAYGLKLNAYRSVSKDLPVLLTEYGYGSLGDPDRNTVEGRVRQWAWFKSVGEQIADLKIAGPMAFYLPPYFEGKSLEFGLSVPSRDAAGSVEPGAGSLKPADGVFNELSAPSSQLPALGPKFTAGGLSYKPSDFGLQKPEPWMEQIGRRFGKNEATPALAWLYDQGRRHPYKPKDWTVSASPPSPVVIDFIAGDGLIQIKRYGGYLAMRSEAPRARLTVDSDRLLATRARLTVDGDQSGRSATVINKAAGKRAGDAVETELRSDDGRVVPIKSGVGQIVLYNFSDRAVTGNLQVTEGRELLTDTASLEIERILEPMCRIVIPVEINVPADALVKNTFALEFVEGKQLAPNSQDLAASSQSLSTAHRLLSTGSSTDRRSPSTVYRTPSTGSSPKSTASIFSTAFYPEASGMEQVVQYDFSSAASDQRSTAGNLDLLASRPLATEEPRLEASNGRWRATRGVEITETSEGNWQFQINQFPAEPNKPAMVELPLPDNFEFPDGGMMRFNYRLLDSPNLDPKTGKFFELYFRTANGNLYQVWPRQYATAAWQEYTEVKENYTMAFYGRANLPWRFKDNRPVALVFFFRPGETGLPATYEVKGARIVRYGSKPIQEEH